MKFILMFLLVIITSCNNNCITKEEYEKRIKSHVEEIKRDIILQKWNDDIEKLKKIKDTDKLKDGMIRIYREYSNAKFHATVYSDNIGITIYCDEGKISHKFQVFTAYFELGKIVKED